MTSGAFRDVEIHDMLCRLEIPRHEDGFWVQLESRLDTLEAAAPSSPSHRKRSLRLDRVATAKPPRRNRHRTLLRMAAAAAAVIAAVGFWALTQDESSDTKTVDSIPDSTTTPKSSTSGPPTTGADDEESVSTTRTDPDPDSAIPLVGGDPVDGRWSEPADLGPIDVGWVSRVVPGTNKVLHFEIRDVTEEGCEGGPTPLHRLVLTELVSGQRTVLIDELDDYDQSIEIGPEGRIAIIGGCDANGWLAAVGRLSNDDELALTRLSGEPDERLNGNNNAGMNVVWSADGEVLFFDSIRVDATTGETLDPYDPTEPPPPVRVHAELADGSRLVSATDFESSDNESSFWLVSSSAPVDQTPEGPPLFSGQASYPAAGVALSADGRKLAVMVDAWSEDATTYIVSSDEVVRVDGQAMLSPSGTHVLVIRLADFGRSGEVVIDLASGETTRIPQMSEFGQAVHWCCGGTSLLIFPFNDMSEYDARQHLSSTSYYTELTEP